MNRIELDPRSREDILKLIRERAAEYVPEWRYEGGADDPGAAIASLFSELFHQTVERFNNIPEKYYTELLNLLGAPSPTVTPASGYISFEAADMEGEPVPVPAGTEVFAAAENENEEDIVFSTDSRVEVTHAQLDEIYYANAREERIERLELDREQPFFASTGGENLQRHRFSICQNDALRLHGPCTVEVTLHQTAHFMEAGTAKLLADHDFAEWLYYDGSDYRSFDSVTVKDGLLTLQKDGDAPFAPEEDGNRYIYCETRGGAAGTIQLSGVSLRTSAKAELAADSLFHNDVPILAGDGGYCFGRRPASYELFYIRSDEVFSKRGALAKLRLDIVPIVQSEVGTEPQYEFNKRIIDKTDAVRVMPDDVFVDQVVWEYRNERGWAPLSVGGNTNPFSCKQQGQGELMVTFTVPEDIVPYDVNAEEGCYIRARVVNVENFMSIRPRWLLPFIKEAALSFAYPAAVRADSVRAENNAKTSVSGGKAGDLQFAAFEMMAPYPPAMYLRFSASPHAMPLSLMFDVAGETRLPCKIIYEAWNGKNFEQVRAVDHTDNLRYTGTVSLYISEPVPECELFGETGYWVRMSLSTFLETASPNITSVKLNVVNAQQRQHAAEQVFSTSAYDAGKTITLLDHPVQRAEVWIDEAGSISHAETEYLLEHKPDDIIIRRDSGDEEHCWVRWKEISTLAQAEPRARVYEMDAYDGVIRFGSGRDGMVPPQGDLNLKINYDFGGGVQGNLPAGRVNSFVGSIPFISGVVNITPMSGGTDRPPAERTLALGNSCIRHRSRALGVFDFEEMTLSHFQRAAHVKCFANTDQDGRTAPGHVCVVVMGRDFSGERMTIDLCREIYEYLAKRCDCGLVASGRLHVVPSMEMTVSAGVLVQLRDLDQAAFTQQQISDNIAALIEKTWRGREIGKQIAPIEVYQAVKATQNVVSVRQILLEGSYYQEGRWCLTALEDNAAAFPFATVVNGVHTVRIG